jgi:protein subunit release factor A
MLMSSKAADILLETGSSFKRIAELTMELVDPNRLSNAGSASKIPMESADLKQLRDALHQLSTISQQINSNEEAEAAAKVIEQLNSIESNGKLADIPSTEEEITVAPTVEPSISLS